MREQSRKVALCGVLCGLAVVVLLLGGLFSLAVYCAPLLAMAVLLPVLEEYGPGTAGAAYGPLLRVSGRTDRGQACSAANQPIGCCLLVHGDCDVAWIWLNLRCP